MLRNVFRFCGNTGTFTNRVCSSADTESGLKHGVSKQQNNPVHVTTLHVINLTEATRPELERETLQKDVKIAASFKKSPDDLRLFSSTSKGP